MGYIETQKKTLTVIFPMSSCRSCCMFLSTVCLYVPSCVKGFPSNDTSDRLADSARQDISSKLQIVVRKIAKYHNKTLKEISKLLYYTVGVRQFIHDCTSRIRQNTAQYTNGYSHIISHLSECLSPFIVLLSRTAVIRFFLLFLDTV